MLKRFSDFQNLSKQLEALHAHSKSKMNFPSLIKAKYFGNLVSTSALIKTCKAFCKKGREER